MACCETMTYQLEMKCDMHPDLRECGDVIVFELHGNLCINYASGGFTTINFCPWCGTAIPSSTETALPAEPHVQFSARK